MGKNKLKLKPLIKKINLLEAKAVSFMIEIGLFNTEKNKIVRRYCTMYGHTEGYTYTNPDVKGAIPQYICKVCKLLYEKKSKVEEDKNSNAPAYFNPFQG